jgi:putative transposase
MFAWCDVVGGCDRWGVLFRTARVGLRLTPAQTRRCFEMLRAGGDVWAALIEVNRCRFARRARPIFGHYAWYREIAGVPVGELSVAAIRSVVRRYSDAYLVTAARKRAGGRARYPRRKRAVMPLRWHRAPSR